MSAFLKEMLFDPEKLWGIYFTCHDVPGVVKVNQISHFLSNGEQACFLLDILFQSVIHFDGSSKPGGSD